MLISVASFFNKKNYFYYQKKPISLTVKFAESEGICKTLEGEVPYAKGDAIITGTEGETWPVNRAIFDQNYEHVEGDVYRKKPIKVLAKCLSVDYELVRPDGAVLKGGPGDWLVEYSPDDHAIVRSDIFEKTYEEVPAD
jgi:hypothetical protein